MSNLPPRDPKNPYWCMRDHGCAAEYGHAGACDLTAALAPNAADDCGLCQRCTSPAATARRAHIVFALSLAAAFLFGLLWPYVLVHA